MFCTYEGMFTINYLSYTNKRACMGVGPQPNYHIYDLYRVLELISTKGPIGRHLLKSEVELTECSVRTILKKMIVSGYIESTSNGQVITQKGKVFLSKQPYFVSASFLNIDYLCIGPYGFCIIARGVPKNVTNGLVQRDEAIKIGGEGATILIYKDGKLHMPPGFLDIELDYPKDVATILDAFNFYEGDILVIGGGKSKRMAQLAAMAALDSLF